MDRLVRFDINCRASDGEPIDVEMCLNPDKFEPVRLEFYGEAIGEKRGERRGAKKNRMEVLELIAKGCSTEEIKKRLEAR
ncbi:MAG: Rpn family recombination-promoting nuclease/putative transposase [Treponema sp.]|nr:Rpn family recombination-promoting nuclease/putative transposase [Treponema sp.]